MNGPLLEAAGLSIASERCIELQQCPYERGDGVRSSSRLRIEGTSPFTKIDDTVFSIPVYIVNVVKGLLSSVIPIGTACDTKLEKYSSKRATKIGITCLI